MSVNLRGARHLRWCDEIDGYHERIHMALCEAGVPCALDLMPPSPECGRSHLRARAFGSAHAEELVRAGRLAATPAMWADLEAGAAELGRRTIVQAAAPYLERVR